MRRFAVNVAVVAVLAMFPVFMGTIGWALILMLDHVPLWVWVIQCLSVVAVAAGLACLIDNRQQSQTPPRHDR